MNISERPNKSGNKIFYYYDYGRRKGQRSSTGIFTYTKPKNQIERNHNKEAIILLEIKKSQATIETQSIGTNYIPSHKYKENFLDYYEEYVKKHRRKRNRHLPCSLMQFRKFLKKDFIAPSEINENTCKEFRTFLLDNLKGQSPQNYFARFKWVIKAAKVDGYFRENPVENVAAKRKPSSKMKKFLEVDEYLAILGTQCTNQEVQFAAIFCMYTGLRWCDVSILNWNDIKEDVLVKRVFQAKTGEPVTLTLHPIALKIIAKQQAKRNAINSNSKLVFALPSANDSNKMLSQWVYDSGVKKYITWSCLRLGFSILLQDKRVDDATVAALLGHTTTKQVMENYKRHRPKDEIKTIRKLPTPKELPTFLED